MPKNGSVYLRLSPGELELWKSRAVKNDKSLSEWIRDTCNARFEPGDPGIITAFLPNDNETPAMIARRQKRGLRSATTCVHGARKGDHCWQCGGKAVAE